MEPKLHCRSKLLRPYPFHQICLQKLKTELEMKLCGRTLAKHAGGPSWIRSPVQEKKQIFVNKSISRPGSANQR
jgi:hypothetical protein